MDGSQPVNLNSVFGIHHFLQPNLRWFSDTLKVPQIMVNWWLGARWFEFLGSPYEKWLLLRVPRLNPKLLSFSWQHFLTKNINFLSPVTCRLCFLLLPQGIHCDNDGTNLGVVGLLEEPTQGITLPKFNIATAKWSRRYMFQRPWSLLVKFRGCTAQGTTTYPTLGRGKLSSKVPWDGNCLFAGGYIWECAPNTVSSFIRT